MADDSWHIQTKTNFHPCDKPRGMKPYILKDLTPEQQIKLNLRKSKKVRSDQKYLAAHPEIRGLLFIILRRLMKARPTHSIHEMIASYFTKASIDIKAEVNEYLKERQNILAENSIIMKQKAKQDMMKLEHDGLDYMLESKEKLNDEDENGSKRDHSIIGSIRPENGENDNVLNADSSAVKIAIEILDEAIDNVFEYEDYISLLSFSGTLTDFDGPVMIPSSFLEQEDDDNDSITFHDDKIMKMKR